MKSLHLGLVIAAALSVPSMSDAQSAIDLYNMARPDLRGTARFMSMGGAFTALGGDLSSLNQNPAGIGIYRSSELGLTLNLDFQSSTTKAQGVSTEENQTKFSFNNFGYVGNMPLNSTGLQSISWGATYSRVASFDRIYSGRISNLGGASLSNYIAAMSNAGGYTPDDSNGSGLLYGDNYNPYLDGNAGWLDILAYQSYVTNDVWEENGDGNFVPNFQGLMGDNTTGGAWFKTREKGYVDEYSFNIGGNVSDMVYWGVGIGVTDMDYKSLTQYGENLEHAYITAKLKTPDQNGNDQFEITDGTADYALTSHLHSSGSGFNLKFGVIVKPINELRLGFAIHTPTWYEMTDTYWGAIDYNYMPSDNSIYQSSLNGSSVTDDGYVGSVDYNYRTPWRMMFGIAGVIGKQGLLSFDYEYRGNNVMQSSDVDGNVYEAVKSDVKTYYKGTHIFRLGGELRVTPQLSLRVGYSYETSPVKKQAENNGEFIWTAGTNPSYTFDRHTQYVTAGLGYRFGQFYADIAYVNKQRESTYHAFTPLIEGGTTVQHSPSATLKDNNNQVVLSFGYKF